VQTVTTGLLRWAGSKRQLLPRLAQFWKASDTRYVEPFAGSACLFFHLHPKDAVLGDLNSELMATYRTLRSAPDAVADCLVEMPSADSEFYYSLRKKTTSTNAAERAARFIYLNRYCFNGLYRTDLDGQFNVPFGGDRTGALPTRKQLRGAAYRLRGQILVSGDFGRTLLNVRDGDFVYLDPPYWVENRRVFREYSSRGFAEREVKRLKRWLTRLKERKVAFVLSYAQSAQAKVLAKGLCVERVSVRRNIAGFTNSRRRASEMLIFPEYMRKRLEEQTES
jgi:DNA adenine methylase